MQNIITNFSVWFSKRYRITLLVTIGILGIGFLSYTSFLPREGFPAIDFPVAIGTSTHLADAETMDQEVTTPLERAIRGVDTVSLVNSTTVDNFTTFIIQFEQGSDLDQELGRVRQEIRNEVELPEGAELELNAINAASIDGVNDLLISVARPGASVSELEQTAETIATRISGLSEIAEAAVVRQTSEQQDTETGDSVTIQREFSRLGYINENGAFVYAPAANIGIKRSTGISTVDLSRVVSAEVEDIADESEYAGYTVKLSGDLAEVVDSQISFLESNALTGFIVIVASLLLLVSWRAAVATAIFMPVVMAATFIGLYITGNSLNTISLFAIILVLGLFVDDAIVVAESIEQELADAKSPIEAIKSAISKVGIADVSGTITTVLVFMPMLAITGVLGEFISLIPITVIMSLSISLVAALAFIPLYSRLLMPKKYKVTKFSQFINLPGNSINYLGDKFSRLINFYLKSKILTAIVIIIGFAAIGFGLFSTGNMGFEIFPAQKDGNDLVVSASFTDVDDIDEAEGRLAAIERRTVEVIGNDLTHASANSLTRDGGQIIITLTEFNSRETKAPEFVERLNAEFANLPNDAGVEAEASLLGVGPPEEDYDFFVQVYGADLDTIETRAEAVKAYIETSRFSGDTAHDGGIAAESVEILNLDRISKRDGRRVVVVATNFGDEFNANTIISAEEKLSERFTDTNAYSFDQGVASDNLDAFNSTIFAFFISIIGIYLVLVLQFNSFLRPLLVLLALPFTFPGLFPGLVASSNPFSFFAMIGLIALSGIVVNNSIMLIDYAIQERNNGMGIADSITAAVKLRFRPLVTTTVTTVAGILPIALSDPFWEGLGLSIVFGLISSTIMVILIFPAFYAVVEKIRMYKERLLPFLNI